MSVDACPDVRFSKDCLRCGAATVRAHYWAQTGIHPSRLCEQCGWSAYDSMTRCAWCGDLIFRITNPIMYCRTKPCFEQARALKDARTKRYRHRRMAS